MPDEKKLTRTVELRGFGWKWPEARTSTLYPSTVRTGSRRLFRTFSSKLPNKGPLRLATPELVVISWLVGSSIHHGRNLGFLFILLRSESLSWPITASSLVVVVDVVGSLLVGRSVCLWYRLFTKFSVPSCCLEALVCIYDGELSLLISAASFRKQSNAFGDKRLKGRLVERAFTVISRISFVEITLAQVVVFVCVSERRRPRLECRLWSVESTTAPLVYPLTLLMDFKSIQTAALLPTKPATD